jgi:hypothetical protein
MQQEWIRHQCDTTIFLSFTSKQPLHAFAEVYNQPLFCIVWLPCVGVDHQPVMMYQQHYCTTFIHGMQKFTCRKSARQMHTQ